MGQIYLLNAVAMETNPLDWSATAKSAQKIIKKAPISLTSDTLQNHFYMDSNVSIGKAI